MTSRPVRLPDPADEVIMIDTPLGPGRLHVSPAVRVRAASPVLLLGHGAGGGVGAPDLVGLARGLPRRGVTVVRYEQPWRVAGRSVAPAPARLDTGWLPAVQRVRADHGLLLVGGRSAGARVACRTAGEAGADGVVCLAFPLHPPGRSEPSRIGELIRPVVPVLCLQGGRDPFGTAAELRAAVRATNGGAPGLTIEEVPGGDHSLRPAGPRTRAPGDPADQDEVDRLVVTAVLGFLSRFRPARRRGPRSPQRIG